MIKLKPEELKVGMKIKGVDWDEDHHFVEILYIGEKLFFYKDKNGEEGTFKISPFQYHLNWRLYEEPRKKKLVAPFFYRLPNRKEIVLSDSCRTEDDAIKWLGTWNAEAQFIKWCSELAVEVDDE